MTQSMLISHDFAYQYGGAERVTEALAEAFPEAAVAVIGGDPAVLERMRVRDRATSLLPLGTLTRRYRALSPAFPLLLPFRSAEIVLSSSYAFAHHVRGTRLHIEYCHSPLRQVWVSYDEYRKRAGAVLAAGMATFRGWLKLMDLRATRRVDVLLASCDNVRRRIHAIYGRDADVIYPPVDAETFSPGQTTREGELAFLVARLVEPYKAVSSVLEAFSTLPYRLVIAGSGRDAPLLQRMAPSNVTFVGYLDDAGLRSWYRRAKIVLFPGEDDFGIVPLEAMACGTPVVALDAGGARETVVDEVTGLRFVPGSLKTAIAEAMGREWDSATIRSHALKFSRPRFATAVRERVEAEIRARTT